jgi:hypothetical protein
MQLCSYLHQALIRMLPALGEPVLQKDFQVRDLVFPPLGARLRELAALQLERLGVSHGLRQNFISHDHTPFARDPVNECAPWHNE